MQWYPEFTHAVGPNRGIVDRADRCAVRRNHASPTRLCVAAVSRLRRDGDAFLRPVDTRAYPRRDRRKLQRLSSNLDVYPGVGARPPIGSLRRNILDSGTSFPQDAGVWMDAAWCVRDRGCGRKPGAKCDESGMEGRTSA